MAECKTYASVIVFHLFMVLTYCSENINTTSLLETVRHLEEKVNGRLDICKQETQQLRESLVAQTRTTDELRSSMKHHEQMLQTLQHSFSKRQVGQGQMVAFTAYVDHNVEHMGIDQVIPFNQVVTNIGGAFNIHTHVFTCPVSGLYFFAFMVSEYGDSELVAKLVIDGTNIVDAVADPVRVDHDQQGGNMAVVQVNKGQSVHVTNYFQKDVFLRTDDGARFASFSGILLQAYDSVTDVVG